MKVPVTVILADDHTIVRQGLRLIIEKNPQIQIVAEASNGLETLALIEQYNPHVLVCDISMPAMTGIEVAHALAKQSCATRILFLTMQEKEEYIMEAMEAGAMGFLTKSTVSEELVEAILKVAEGKEFFSGSVYRKVFNAFRSHHKKSEIRLTPREKEVLQLIAEGLNTKMIADKLFISEYTISNHRANLMKKLSAQNVAELIRKSAELNLIK